MEEWDESLKCVYCLLWAAAEGSGGGFLDRLVSEGPSFGERSFGIWVWSGTRTLSHISLQRSPQSFKGVFAVGSGKVRKGRDR